MSKSERYTIGKGWVLVLVKAVATGGLAMLRLPYNLYVTGSMALAAAPVVQPRITWSLLSYFDDFTVAKSDSGRLK